jgi:hypothetical protein
MSRTLVIATLAGLGICGASLGAAVVIGGESIFHDPRSLEGVKPLIDLATHKTWHWNGGDTLALDAPINIRYQAAGAPQVSVTGPAEAISHVRVTEGRIGADTALNRRNGRKVEAVVSGVPIRKFVVNSHEELDLGEINQPDLDVHINGSGDVTGHGQVGRLNLTISGSGDAKLGGLSVTDDAKVALLGNGDAALAPKGNLRVFIAGNATMTLTAKPKSISRTIIGNGQVEQITAHALEAARIATQEALKNIPPPPTPPMPPIPPGGGPGVISQTNDSITVHDHRDVDLGHIQQQRLKVSLLASGSVSAEGQVDTLIVQVMGSGHANLGMLRARRVEVVIAGSGDVTIAPGEALKVSIMGSGDVRLMTHPAKIERSIMGSGSIIEQR